MSFEILLALLSGAISLLGGLAVINRFIERFVTKILSREQLDPIEKILANLTGLPFGEEQKEVSYKQKIGELTASLTKASEEMDSILLEVAKITAEREKAMQEAEIGLQSLQVKERELQERIDKLENVPLPVAEYFAQLASTGEKQGARRDYMLFGAGVVVSTVVAIVLKILGLG